MDEAERIGPVPAPGEATPAPPVLHLDPDKDEADRIAEELERQPPVICSPPPGVPMSEVLELEGRIAHLEDRDLDYHRQMMDMLERVTSSEAYVAHMSEKVRLCEARCDRMRSAMNLALLTVMASLAVDILVLLYHAGVIG